jgi:hypothetical protein
VPTAGTQRGGEFDGPDNRHRYALGHARPSRGRCSRLARTQLRSWWSDLRRGWNNQSGLGPAIQVQGLEKSYKELRVLRGVDIDVARGSIFALLGSNGAEAIEFATAVSNVVSTPPPRLMLATAGLIAFALTQSMPAAT